MVLVTVTLDDRLFDLAADAAYRADRIAFAALGAQQRRLLADVAGAFDAGEGVYFDALVIEFDRDYVKLSDPLRGKSIYLFRKIFGSGQKPENGVALDPNAKDGIPDPYRVGKPPSAFEVKLWRRFWELANDAKAAAHEGVRVAQIQANAIRPVPGKIYTLSLEHAGGMNVTAADIPDVLRKEQP